MIQIHAASRLVAAKTDGALAYVKSLGLAPVKVVQDGGGMISITLNDDGKALDTLSARFGKPYETTRPDAKGAFSYRYDAGKNRIVDLRVNKKGKAEMIKLLDMRP